MGKAEDGHCLKNTGVPCSACWREGGLQPGIQSSLSPLTSTMACEEEPAKDSVPFYFFKLHHCGADHYKVVQD